LPKTILAPDTSLFPLPHVGGEGQGEGIKSLPLSPLTLILSPQGERRYSFQGFMEIKIETLSG